MYLNIYIKYVLFKLCNPVARRVLLQNVSAPSSKTVITKTLKRGYTVIYLQSATKAGHIFYLRIVRPITNYTSFTLRIVDRLATY